MCKCTKVHGYDNSWKFCPMCGKPYIHNVLNEPILQDYPR